MSLCGPSCAVPSCESVPVIGLGSGSWGGFGSGIGSGFGYGYGSDFGGGVSTGSLGVLSGVQPSCINQLPPCECYIQPPACVVTFPGPILSATCEPVAVGGYAPCAAGGCGFGGLGGGLYGGYGFGGLGGGIYGERVGDHCGSLGGRGLGFSLCN